MLGGLFIEHMEGNKEIFAEVMNDPAFRNIAAGHLVRQIYGKIRDEGL